VTPTTLLLIIFVILLLGGSGPWWPYSQGWGYRPFGSVLGFILICLLIFFLVGGAPVRGAERPRSASGIERPRPPTAVRLLLRDLGVLRR
jgi:hypothetical protein